MSYVENPEAIGNPDEEPRVHLGSDLVAALKALGAICDCGGMNGYHAEGCEPGGRMTMPSEQTSVPDTDWRNLALRLMAELSWCVGFVEQVGECVPDSTRAVLDDALARLTERAGLTNIEGGPNGRQIGTDQ